MKAVERPKSEDFKTMADFVEAIIDWKQSKTQKRINELVRRIKELEEFQPGPDEVGQGIKWSGRNEKQT